MIKKYLKIFIVNFIIIAFIILAVEFILVYALFKEQNWKNTPFKYHLVNQVKAYFSDKYFDINKELRKTSYPENYSGKPPLAVMGCSFAYGLNLKDNQTFSAQLSQYTGRIVYNLGIVGTSPREILYILENDDIRNTLIKEEPEYIIYPYISHHLKRLYTDIRFYANSPYYRLKDGKLQYYNKNKFITSSMIYRRILEYKQKKISDDEAFALFCVYLKQINEEIKKHYKNTKFVVLVYEDNFEDILINPNHNWSPVIQNGIIVINVPEITHTNLYNPEYLVSETDIHPNSRAWATVVPAISTELNL